MSKIALEIKIRPGIPPDDRCEIEDLLADAGLEVAGGGGYDDGSESDITLFVEDVAAGLPQILAILRKAKVGPESVVQQQEPETEFPVYS